MYNEELMPVCDECNYLFSQNFVDITETYSGTIYYCDGYTKVLLR